MRRERRDVELRGASNAEGAALILGRRGNQLHAAGNQADAGMVGGEDAHEKLVVDGGPGDSRRGGVRRRHRAGANAKEAAPAVEFRPQDEGLAVAIGVTGRDLLTIDGVADGRGRTKAEGQARERHRLVGQVAEGGLVAELVGVVRFIRPGSERVASRYFDLVAEHGAVNDLGRSLRDELKARIAVEPRQIDKTQHRVGVHRIEHIRLGTAEFGGKFPQRDVADGAAEVGEMHRDENILEGRDFRSRHGLRRSSDRGIRRGGRGSGRRGVGGPGSGIHRLDHGRTDRRRRGRRGRGKLLANDQARKRGDDANDANDCVLFIHEEWSGEGAQPSADEALVTLTHAGLVRTGPVRSSTTVGTGSNPPGCSGVHFTRRRAAR